MGFVVDKVSEDSFYENLLLGLSRVLEKSPCISNLSLKRFLGVKQVDVRTWEHNNGVILPEDLRGFYSSTNGFLYTYDFSYDYTNPDIGKPVVRQGRIQINAINDLQRTYSYETKTTAQVEQLGDKYKLSLSRESKVFELSTVDEYAKVVLVYLNPYSIPTIWLYTSSMVFSYLAEDFTTYFRMCIAHLGIPCWQYTVSKEGLPEWSREIFQIIAPGVLEEDRNLIEIPKLNVELNRIDPNIFITQPCTNDFSNVRGTALQSVQQNKSKERKSKPITRRYHSAKVGKKPTSGV